MAERTEELKRDIESTRTHMSTTLDAIGDRVSPGRVAERRWNKVRQSTGRISQSIMGTPRQAGAGDGSPLAVGAVAFGIGVLLGSAASPSKEEIRLVAPIAEPLKQEAQSFMEDVATPMKETVADALNERKAVAADAVAQVKDQASTEAAHLSETASHAKDEVTRKM